MTELELQRLRCDYLKRRLALAELLEHKVEEQTKTKRYLTQALIATVISTLFTLLLLVV